MIDMAETIFLVTLPLSMATLLALGTWVVVIKTIKWLKTETGKDE